MKITKRKLESLINESLSRSGFPKTTSLAKVYKLGGQPLMLEMADQLKSIIPDAKKTLDHIRQGSDMMDALLKKIPDPDLTDPDIKAFYEIPDLETRIKAVAKDNPNAPLVSKARSLMFKDTVEDYVKQIKSIAEELENNIGHYLKFTSSQTQNNRDK
jgi:hypothetical protein